MGNAEHQSQFSPEFQQEPKQAYRISTARNRGRHSISRVEQLASLDGVGDTLEERGHELCFFRDAGALV
jgi:hypothetical protein